MHNSILYIFLALSISSLGNAPALQLSSLEGLSFNLPAEDSQPLLSLKGPGRNDVLVVNEHRLEVENVFFVQMSIHIVGVA